MVGKELKSKEVGVARITTSTSLALFLLIAKHKFYINGFANNSSFQQSKFESKILYIIRIIDLKISNIKRTTHTYECTIVLWPYL